MTTRDSIFRLLAWFRHLLTSSNTLGNGVHSPHLFYMVSMLLYDTNSYYCFREIEKERNRLRCAERIVSVEDYGTGRRRSSRMLKDIAKTSLASPKESQLLFRIVNYLHPKTVLELGTSLGITTAYLSKATEQGNVYSLEGSKEIAEIARHMLRRLHADNVAVVEGNIDDTLSGILNELHHVDVAFMDANHTEEATMRYFNQIASYCSTQSIVIVDDIYYSRGMYNAWKQIQQDERVSCTMDLYDMGIVFFDPQYLRKHYRMRV